MSPYNRSNGNSNVGKIMAKIYENFNSVGYNIKEEDGFTVIHLPHLVSVPSFSRDEQREQVEMLTRIAVNDSEVPNVTFTCKDTKGTEGQPNWHHFYVEIRIPKV